MGREQAGRDKQHEQEKQSGGWAYDLGWQAECENPANCEDKHKGACRRHPEWQWSVCCGEFGKESEPEEGGYCPTQEAGAVSDHRLSLRRRGVGCQAKSVHRLGHIRNRLSFILYTFKGSVFNALRPSWPDCAFFRVHSRGHAGFAECWFSWSYLFFDTGKVLATYGGRLSERKRPWTAQNTLEI